MVHSAELYTTIRYVVPADTSFTITYPAGTTEMWFEPSSQTDEVNATNQTDSQPIITFTNTGNVEEYFDIKINETNEASIVLKCGSLYGSWQDECDCEGTTNDPMTATKCCNITTTNSRVNASALAISDTQTLWCWGKFESTPYGTYVRNMTSTSATS
jgi:hypothetical protein